ncbi:HAMP domain-containing histidine kinase [Oceanobacillus sp. J11TS1]|uniref:HAMP domain-containing sensor histidine kinase n=1 Tax=Oceanobacillus sp. J11TS1 TaxID=2807191 RepID=UPI001B13B91A|nr:HAMP domain-containing histidine kinase [Oceanobacillus sp. J11TS1]GIO24345.1 sensor histidine kinase YkoH [Oceanobacillus sp. J11TS1]
MTLRKKIILFSSVFMFLVIAISHTAIYFLFYRTATNGEIDQLAVQVDALVEAIANNDSTSKETLRNLLTAYLPANGMIRIVDETGDDIVPLQTKAEHYANLEVGYTTTETDRIVQDEKGRNYVIIEKPIIWENGDIVTVHVANELVYLDKTMGTLTYVLFFSSAVILIPTIIASILLSRFLLTPIQKLKDTMQRNIHNKNWQKIDVDDRSKDELYEMEVTFNEMIDSLKENFEKQETFVSNASHELKTPIQIIKSYAQLIERQGKQRPELLDESVRAIDSEADRMQKLVEQLLLLAKHKNENSKQKVNIRKIVSQVIQTFQKAYPERNIHCEVEEGDYETWGNTEQLKQIPYIFIENALKYSEDDVLVTMSTDKKKIVIQCTDFGEGIAPKEQEKIFDRFYRVDRARNRETGGTGLGLAIAKEIIEIHGGKITVKSELGQGSVFTWTLTK